VIAATFLARNPEAGEKAAFLQHFLAKKRFDRTSGRHAEKIFKNSY
jgi:hypothetical protein